MLVKKLLQKSPEAPEKDQRKSSFSKIFQLLSSDSSKNESSEKSLAKAISDSNEPLVESILSSGSARTNVNNLPNTSLMHLAVSKSSPYIISLLLGKMPLLHMRDSEGQPFQHQRSNFRPHPTRHCRREEALGCSFSSSRSTFRLCSRIKFRAAHPHSHIYLRLKTSSQSRRAIRSVLFHHPQTTG